MAGNLRTSKKFPHLVGTGVNAIVIPLPDEYSSIGAAVGVAKIAGDPPEGASGASVGSAKLDGQVVTLRLSYKIGTKRKFADIICATANIKTAISQLHNKTFNGGDVIRAYFPRRRRYT
jgi:hypothetical protein